MAAKEFMLDNGIAVTVAKRRGNRNLRLTLGADGGVRVSIPAWAPYKAGLEFAYARRDWILAHQTPVSLLKDGQSIGKAHRLALVPAEVNTAAARLSAGLVTVRYPNGVDVSDASVQAAARDGAVHALRAEAKRLLPQRLSALAAKHGFSYGRVSVKRMKSRWGSCDQHSNIVLNLFLMKLPWDLIDYVLLHELAHTKVLRHGPDFWQELTAVLPDAKQRRKRLREFHPVLDS